MIILGLNAFHGDSAAALIRDGVLVAAAEEERFRRVKHWAGFPSQAIAYCLREGGLRLADVDHVAVNQDGWAQRLRRLRYAIAHPSGMALALDRMRNRRQRQAVPELLAAAFPGDSFRGVFHPVEHHLAHLSSAFHVSPFDAAVAVSVDGFGDFASAAWGVGEGSGIAVDGRIYFPHSLGVFYQALTQYLGFPHYGDEYKVMGLAPFGAPTVLPALRKIVEPRPDGSFTLDLAYFRHQCEPIGFSWADGAPQFADLFSPALEDLLGPRRQPDEPVAERHRDIAASVQAMYEEVLFNLLGQLHRRHGIDNLALAGGCAANSVANGKICRMTPFRRVYVQAAAGDAGGAIGAAFTTWHRLGGARGFEQKHAAWGPQFGASEIAAAIAERRCEIEAVGGAVAQIGDEGELCRRTASAIADGKVSAGFRAAWNADRGRSAIARSSAIRAATT